MPRRTFQDCCCQCPCPFGKLLLIHASPADSFGSVSCGVTAPFFWVLVSTRFYLCPPSPGTGEPGRLPSMRSHRVRHNWSDLAAAAAAVLWKSYNQIPLAFKVRFLGDSQSFCRIPMLRSLTWGSELSQQWEIFFGVIVLQFVGHPYGRYGIWLYRDCTPPTILVHILSLDVECLFDGFWYPPVDSSSVVSCNSGTVAGGDEYTSFYSTIQNWKPVACFSLS